MIKLISRIKLFLLAAILIAATIGIFNPISVKGDWGYGCDASEHSCDDGSGGYGGGGGGGGGGSGAYTCPTVAGCGNWGCYANSQGVQTCALYNLEGSTHCTGTRTCTRP